jgi:hypothetical protein
MAALVVLSASFRSQVSTDFLRSASIFFWSLIRSPVFPGAGRIVTDPTAHNPFRGPGSDETPRRHRYHEGHIPEGIRIFDPPVPLDVFGTSSEFMN